MRFAMSRSATQRPNEALPASMPAQRRNLLALDALSKRKIVSADGGSGPCKSFSHELAQRDDGNHLG
jgi:hypothetical protein